MLKDWNGSNKARKKQYIAGFIEREEKIARIQEIGKKTKPQQPREPRAHWHLEKRDQGLKAQGGVIWENQEGIQSHKQNSWVTKKWFKPQKFNAWKVGQ